MIKLLYSLINSEVALEYSDLNQLKSKYKTLKTDYDNKTEAMEKEINRLKAELEKRKTQKIINESSNYNVQKQGENEKLKDKDRTIKNMERLINELKVNFSNISNQNKALKDELHTVKVI